MSADAGGRRFGDDCEIELHSVRVAAAPQDTPPFAVDAQTFEEDTNLILSTEQIIQEPKESVDELVREMVHARRPRPGDVVVKGGRPLRLLAVVHDIERKPTWREEWVAKALGGVFREAERRRVHSVAIPILGAIHGSLETGRFVELLAEALAGAQAKHLAKLWVVVPAGSGCEVLQLLQDTA